MPARLLTFVCLLGALSFNRDCSCVAIIKNTRTDSNNFLGVPETPSRDWMRMQMGQIKLMRENYASQLYLKKQLGEAMKGQRKEMEHLHASQRKAFFDLQDSKQQHDTQLNDEQVSQQALNNIMIVANEVGRLVQWKSVTLDTFINSNFPDLTNHLKMMITTAHANAHILQKTAASSAIKELVSKLISSLEDLTKLLITSVTAINGQAETVVHLYNTVAGQAAEQQTREANLLKKAMEAKATEKKVYDRARVLIEAMGCPRVASDDGPTTAAPKLAMPTNDQDKTKKDPVPKEGGDGDDADEF